MTELRIVTYGSIMEETPEGLWRADCIRRFMDARRRRQTKLEAELETQVNAALDRAFLHGE